MRSERRLAKLESSLPPRQALLLWLSHVHEHGSLEAYVAELLGRPSAVSPVVALTDRVAAAARTAHAREPRPLVREAERRATLDTVFLLTLVLDLERVATETMRIGSLRLAALRWETRARTAEGAADRQGWADWRTGVLDLASELARTEAARLIVEEHYLGGRESLPPTALVAWLELQAGVAALVSTIPSLPGGRRARRPAGDAIRKTAERTAPDEARALVDRVRAQALDLLGDHEGAAAIVERALRGGA